MLVGWDMNQHLSLCWVSQLNLLNLRFCPLPSPLPRGEGMIVLKPTIIGFSAICPLFHGEGIMVLKPTIIGLSAIRPLSPWERVRERAKRKTQETSSKKMATQKYT